MRHKRKDEDLRHKRKDEDMGHKRKGSFASKKMQLDMESPYIVATKKNMIETSLKDPVSASKASITTLKEIQEVNCNDNIAYYIKKVSRDYTYVVIRTIIKVL